MLAIKQYLRWTQLDISDVKNTEINNAHKHIRRIIRYTLYTLIIKDVKKNEKVTLK